MHCHFLNARQLVGIHVHLDSGNPASVTPVLTGLRRDLATVLLAAVLVALEVTFLSTAGPAAAVAMNRNEASAVWPMAIGQSHEVTARRGVLGCRPWYPYR